MCDENLVNRLCSEFMLLFYLIHGLYVCIMISVDRAIKRKMEIYIAALGNEHN